MFQKEISFTVTNDEILDTIRLDRIVGQLEVQLTEAFSFPVGELQFRAESIVKFPFDPHNTYYSGYIDLNWIEGDFIPFVTDNYVYNATILPDRSGDFISGFGVTVTSGGYTREGFEFSDTHIYPNRKTILTGSLYSDDRYQGFYVSADSTYGEPNMIKISDTKKPW